MRAWDNGHEALEMSRVQQDLYTATKMFHDSTLLYLLPCMVTVTVHLTQRACLILLKNVTFISRHPQKLRKPNLHDIWITVTA